MKLGEVELNLEQAIEINANTKNRVYFTQMGAAPGKKIMVAGRSVPWKGVKGKAFASQFPEQAANLGKAVAVGDAVGRVKGTAILVYPDGTRKYMSLRAARMAMHAHPEYYQIIELSGASKRPWVVPKTKGRTVYAAGPASR